MPRTQIEELDAAGESLGSDDGGIAIGPLTRWRRAAPRAARTGTKGAALSPCTWLVGVAFVVYAAFAYNQYRQFQVGACDLGIFYQTVQGWAFHGWPLVPIKGYSQLGDHFSPMFMVLAPLLWVYNSPLVIVFAQAALLVSSAIPVYLVVVRAWGKPVASAITAAYLLSIGMQGAVAFPVHEVMFSAPLIAWGLERASANRWTTATVLIGLTVFVKEDLGLLCVMFALYALRNRKWRHALAISVFGVGMFVLCVKVLIPHMNPNGFTYSNDYAQTLHSANFTEAVKYMFTHPADTVRSLFGNPAKRDAWFHILAPVAFLCLASPIALLGLPMMLTRMLSDRDTEWSWHLYYDMPLMPIVFIGAVDGVQRLTRVVSRVAAKVRERRALVPVEPSADPTASGGGAEPDESDESDGGAGGHTQPSPTSTKPRIQLQQLLGGAFAVVALGTAVNDSRGMQLDLWWNHGWFESSPAWDSWVRNSLSYIPSGVEVRATNNLTIPLADRDTVTLIGSHVEKGDWAAVDTGNPQCPIGPSDIPPYMAMLKSGGFKIVKQEGTIVILHKG